ncbi:methylenetetrahydrofolate reductase [Sulfurospirillum sp. 1612]|uniref:methylenetetrahydrofolate reductase n=1 Tax=Sulfurospirillum sp. 1612 TaxID=3094835 RepID=UPI002F938BCF
MLKDKIRSRKHGILLYGITPPKMKHTTEEIHTIAATHIQRINALDIDALVLYDIQDESDRTSQIRPFPFVETLDSSYYKEHFLQDIRVPVIVYKAVGKYKKDAFSHWLESTKNQDFYSVFVGAASQKSKTNLSMRDAYALKKEINPDLILGGIVIPERHMSKGDEHLRVFSKIDRGCEFFISQAVYNLAAAKQFLDDYLEYATLHHKPLVPIIFTLTPCGSTKTLEFMKWLGVNIPVVLEEKLKNSDDILEESVRLSRENFEALYRYGKEKGIPIGCNVESVAIRKVEIEASLQLLDEVKESINIINKEGNK